jgi:two-component system, OmpR family, phosphate regulon response regulator OmpR
MHTGKPHVLVVDDDARLRGLIARYLWGAGFVPLAADGAASARTLLTSFIFDAIVLDIMMPGEDGLALLASLPEGAPPVLLLTARGEAGDRIAGLRAGADDYLPKPFEPEELALRLQALIRRTRRAEPGRVGPWTLAGDRLEGPGGPIDLTAAEGALLRALVAARGRVVARADLAAAAGLSGGERAVDVLVARLRAKLGAEGARALATVRGRGYALSGESGA